MASFAAACRLTARVAGNRASVRGLTTSARCLAAQNFSMPALSPTMTEGNIASWKVKEGDSFSAGDVLLEIETDKATMDVEAQEDGVMVKIMSQDGSKAVQVGTRIAVTAEAGDDVSSIEIPAAEQPKQAEAAKEESSASQSTQTESSSEQKSAAKRPSSSGDSYQHRYPLLPAVGHLVKQHGLSEQDVSKIKGTGPNGRLLKGDVLAYVGSINPETPEALEAFFHKLAHLDLSNIKVAEQQTASTKPLEAEAAVPQAQPPAKEIVELQVPVSMEEVLHIQKKLQKSIGTFLPLSTFLGRAAAVANTDLPPLARKPTSSELFDQVLGLNRVKSFSSSQGSYLPEISAPSFSSPTALSKKADIIDILAGPAKKPATRPAGIPTVPGLSNGINVFSLAVPKAEAARAQIFLERCKQILEEEPGRLVL